MMVPALWLMVIALCARCTSIAVPAVPVMLPELAIAPENVERPPPRKTPVCAVMLPLLVMPPSKRERAARSDIDAELGGIDGAAVGDAAAEARDLHWRRMGYRQP